MNCAPGHPCPSSIVVNKRQESCILAFTCKSLALVLSGKGVLRILCVENIAQMHVYTPFGAHTLNFTSPAYDIAWEVFGIFHKCKTGLGTDTQPHLESPLAE